MGRKSRHYRDESDLLLGYYGRTMAETNSVRHPSPLYSSTVSSPASSVFQTPPSNSKESMACLDSPGSQQHKRNSPRKGYRVHRVSYTANNHVGVLFRLYGSAFPQVLPFCAVNFVWTLIVYQLKVAGTLDLTFHSSIGHSFMGLLVSFLIVSRSKISYDRFMDFRRTLADTYRSCREVAQLATVYTFLTQTEAARQWRQDVCYRTLLLLRVTMDALLWSSTERDRWEDEYFKYHSDMDCQTTRLLSSDEDDDDDDHDGVILNHLQNNNSNGHRRHDDDDEDLEDMPQVSEHFFQFRQLTHGRRSLIDENFRAPMTFSHVLRMIIMEHPKHLGYKMPVNEYRDLVLLVGQFNKAYHQFRVLIFTPYPFPLVQMTRAFLFVWVYTLPMVLLKEYRLWSSLVIVILVSFGFVGIEYVSMALDDPFGDDTNDVDEHGMALLVYEDVYMAIYRTDGPVAAAALRQRILERYQQGRGLDCYRNDMKGYEMWEPPHLQQQQKGPEGRSKKS